MGAPSHLSPTLKGQGNLDSISIPQGRDKHIRCSSPSKVPSQTQSGDQMECVLLLSSLTTGKWAFWITTRTIMECSQLSQKLVRQTIHMTQCSRSTGHLIQHHQLLPGVLVS